MNTNEEFIDYLQETIEKLEAENNSLWSVLDALRESQEDDFPEILQAINDKIELNRILLRMPTNGTVN
jgi:prefoldin subunit 5